MNMVWRADLREANFTAKRLAMRLTIYLHPFIGTTTQPPCQVPRLWSIE